VGTIGGPKGVMLDEGVSDQELLDLKVTQGRPHFFVDMRICDDAGRVLPHDGVTVGDLQVRDRQHHTLLGCTAPDEDPSAGRERLTRMCGVQQQHLLPSCTPALVRPAFLSVYLSLARCVVLTRYRATTRAKPLPQTRTAGSARATWPASTSGGTCASQVGVHC